MKFNINCIKSWLECLAIIVGVVIAYCALDVAKEQIASSNASQKEATAQQAYGEYLKLAIEHPELAGGLREQNESKGDSQQISASECNCEKEKEKEKEMEKYEWFVSYFLNSGEQIYLATKGDDAWERTLQLQVCYHKKFFLGPRWDQDMKNTFNKKYVDLIESGIDWCGFRKKASVSTNAQ